MYFMYYYCVMSISIYNFGTGGKNCLRVINSRTRSKEEYATSFR